MSVRVLLFVIHDTHKARILSVGSYVPRNDSFSLISETSVRLLLFVIHDTHKPRIPRDLISLEMTFFH